MKLKNKLFINFGILFFLTLNILGCFLIKSTFNTSIKKAIDESFREYAVIYSNIKSGENLNNLFLTTEEIISIKSENYLSIIQNPSINLEFRTKDNNIIYSSNSSKFNLPNELFSFDNKKANYIISNLNNTSNLIISKEISFNNQDFSFTYINNIDSLYTTQNNNIIILLELNFLFILVFLFIIYLISFDITKPLSILSDNIDEIIRGNFNKKLSYSSNIEELNTISTNFNIMSEEIKNKIILLSRENLSKQRFINNLTHEIKTPLTSIIGYSSLMVNKKINDIDLIHKSFETIYNDGKRIESLTTNLIKLITLDKINLDIEDVSIISVLEDIKNTIKIKLIENNINLSIHGFDFVLKTDRYLLTTLLSNFIDNSIKALSNNSVLEKNIIIVLNKNSLVIKDSGIGIPKEDLDKIFEPFYMVNKSRVHSIGGFGLGLTICLKIIEILDIKFYISSTPNKGTTIKLHFKGDFI
ncbi:HAMP domain-containing histidine kinase [Clostridium chauvoei]|uniref:sensor histidine kinase n=1 Tax=Clostridium chauvoei TaxID=46867 RepID=UPI001C85AED4|nr:HAMP domain-containing sensor histidine kinase [Clostridium chauvoei]MBX7317011.1 HAMP domain-containing histidine kinase [Clostridium chauvoei]MBX7344735.1 HAMP domain-containing histidine kinase [Clostridium chauvoei]